MNGLRKYLGLILCGGGSNRVKKGFHHMRHVGLNICQHESYLHAKTGNSSMKNEEIVAKILFQWGSKNRVKVGFHCGGGVKLGIIIFQLEIYPYAKSGSSRMKNEGVMTFLEGMGESKDK